MAGTVGIKDLFDHERMEYHWHMLPILFYLPIGVIIFILRIFIGIHAFTIASILPKGSQIRNIILRSLCAILGIIVREVDIHSKQKGKSKVLVSNHVSNFDHLAIDLVYSNIVPGVWDLPKFLNWILGFHDFSVKEGRDIFIQNVRQHLDEPNSIPILTHPEGATTNAKAGLLKFSSWPFNFHTLIQPICISVYRPPPFKISPSIVGSRWWSDLFWILFIPCTIFDLKYLEPVKKNEKEDVETYSKRIQKLMADSMGISATNFTDIDKVEYSKRLLHDQRSQATQETSSQGTSRSPPQPSLSSSSSSSSISSKIELMAKNVKEVLPQVPMSVIKSDIAITENVDETITRLLDGTVLYNPEVVVKYSSSGSSVKEKRYESSKNPQEATLSPLLISTAAKSFAKSPKERMRSYKERKHKMIMEARNRYIRVHRLDPSLIIE